MVKSTTFARPNQAERSFFPPDRVTIVYTR